MGGLLYTIVGMCGSGKTTAAEILEKSGKQYYRFGQLTIDTLKERGLEVNAQNEKSVREGLRKEHGMGAFATLSVPKLQSMLEEGDVVADGLYSWSEYVALKKAFPEMKVVHIAASPKTRYERLAIRKHDAGDENVKYRELTKEEAQARDVAEIENIEKGGPIAMADITIVNEGDLKSLTEALQAL